ncbi:MAG TPA: hypothetical protein GX510_07675 [Firmicutes bacterium]|nr:hypothetical protein [Candidatus Fermentithermobacillaceae bacterium]
MQEEKAARSLWEVVGIEKRAKVLLVGTFHFAYYNKDIFNPERKEDMLSERRQAEISEVVRRLASFRPTKVALEARAEHDSELNRDYQAYRSGKLQLRVDEHHQLGFRVAGMMNHDRVYSIDEWGKPYFPESELLDYARRRLGDRAAGLSEMDLWYSLHESFLPEYARRYVSYSDQHLAEHTLREHLLFLNSDEHLAVSHGMYLAWVDSPGGDYTMPDYITSWWYNRNLRIFANLKRITESCDDRILVIFGVGHVPILKHAIECSPKHELVDLRTYLA